ncbi:hypothetical protein FISHEDRAFT_31761, partial [Fistulina hepatica ATCC 64428]
MAESTQSSTCPVLTGENNFTIWKIRIRAKLASAKRLLGVVTISTIGLSTIQPTDSWDIRDQKAHGIVVEHLSDSLVMALVTENQSAKELMDAVISKFETQSTGLRSYYILTEMMGMKWDGALGESLTDHITRIRSLGSQLRGMTK